MQNKVGSAELIKGCIRSGVKSPHRVCAITLIVTGKIDWLRTRQHPSGTRSWCFLSLTSPIYNEMWRSPSKSFFKPVNAGLVNSS